MGMDVLNPSPQAEPPLQTHTDSSDASRVSEILSADNTLEKSVPAPFVWPRLTPSEGGLLACVGLLFAPMFQAMISLWTYPEAPQSYGLVVLPAAAILAWMLRNRVRTLDSRPAPLGWALFAGGLSLHLFATYKSSLTVSCLGFLLVAVGLTGIRHGFGVVRRLWFPFTLLLAMVPLPTVLLNTMTISLQKASIYWASLLVKPFSESSVEGTLLHLGDYTVYVAAPCSGLTIVLPLLLVAAYYLYIVEAPAWKKMALLGLTFPIAMAVNSVRVALIGLVGEAYGHNAGAAFHDYSGIITLLVGSTVFFYLANEMKCARLYEGVTLTQTPEDVRSDAPRRARPAPGRRYRPDVVLFACFGAAVPAMFLAAHSAPGYIAQMPGPTPLPLTFNGWHGTPLPSDPVTQSALPTARITAILYEKSGLPALETIVIASRDRNDLHVPEACLTDKGYTIIKDEATALTVPGVKGGVWPFHRVLVRSNRDEMLLLYGYDHLPETSGSALVAQLLAKLKGTSRQPAYFLRVSAPITGNVDETEKRLRDFAAAMLGIREQWQESHSPP
jgi:exosortase